jgi:DNA polymerase-1
MKRAKQQSEFPDYRPPVRELVVDPSLETVMAELDRLMTAPELAFDIETKPETKVLCHQPNGAIYTPDLIRCISFSDRPEWAISIPFDRAGGQHRWSMDVEKKIWAGISRLLGQPGTLKIAHNLNFDLLQLAGHSVFVAPPYYDTMIAHNRANLDLAKKKLKKLRMMRLAFCTALYTEEPYYKDDYKDENKTEDWKGYDKEYWIYNAKDSAVLHEIKAATWRDIQELGMTDMFKTEMQTSVPLNCMGIQGVKRDPALIQEIKTTTKTTIETLQVSLNETVGYELNVKSSQQVQRLLYSELNLPIMFHKKTGRPTVDEASLAKLYQRTKHPVLRQIKELARFRDFQSNYIDPPISLDDRTRTTYNQARTCTARLSSSDAILGEGKNSQVVPSRPRPGENEYNTIIKLYKQTYAADPGMLMWRRDYIQAEAMVVAWLAEDLQQINDFLTGADIHCRTVQILYGCSYEDAVAGYKNKDPEWVMRRNLGKPVRHGFNYKLGENELSRLFAKEGINMEPKQCKRLLQTMAANVLPVMRWHDEVVATLQETRTIVNPLGLRRRFLGVIDNDCIREAIAFSPQSTVAQLTNFSTLRIYNELGSELDLLLNQHDAIIGQSPVEQLQTHCTKIGQLMLQPMTIKGRVLVIPSDLEVGPNWGSLSKPSWSSES